jgi:cytochrome c oxidase subunit 1
MHLVGLLGMPRRTYTYPAGLGFEFYNQIETVGALLLGLSQLIFAYNMLKTWRKPATAPADPWNGATLEWAIPSPPQEWNFNEIPVVHSRDPLWELKRERGGRLPEPEKVSGAGIHLPNPSFWPLLAAVGVAMIFTSLLLMNTFHAAGIIVSVAVLFFSVLKWAFEPAG